MNLSTFKKIIETAETVHFALPSGEQVPNHYHVTEIGKVTKDFIDCGGTLRQEKVVNFQLWYSDDTDHSLKPEKLLAIIELAESKLGIEDVEIEVEYQSDTIGKYGLEYNGTQFILATKQTACLASDQCGIPQEKPKINISQLVASPSSSGSCTPGGGCC